MEGLFLFFFFWKRIWLDKNLCSAWWVISIFDLSFKCIYLIKTSQVLSLYLNITLHNSITCHFLCCQGNHSCVPNAEASFPDNNFLLHLNALSDISPGEVSRGCWLTDAKMMLWGRPVIFWSPGCFIVGRNYSIDSEDRNSFGSLSDRLKRPTCACLMLEVKHYYSHHTDLFIS